MNKMDHDSVLTVPEGNGFIVDAQDQGRMLTVAEMCRLTGVTRKTLYYYDKIDLLKPVERRGSQGSKIYDEEALRKLLWIRACQKAGLLLCEIRQMLGSETEGQICVLQQALQRLIREQDKLKEQQKEVLRLLQDLEESIHGKM